MPDGQEWSAPTSSSVGLVPTEKHCSHHVSRLSSLVNAPSSQQWKKLVGAFEQLLFSTIPGDESLDGAPNHHPDKTWKKSKFVWDELDSGLGHGTINYFKTNPNR